MKYKLPKYAVLVESFDQVNPAVTSEFGWPKPG
jgi:hypothetical protein